MDRSLQSELHQKAPFESLEVEAYVGIVRAAALLTRRLEELLKSHGLTPVLYNVLRILRGAGEQGIPSTSVAARMVSRVPDVTRLVDRLVAMKLVERRRTDEDRRLVLLRPTERGLALLASLDAPVAEIHKSQLGHMSPEELRTLNDLLAKVRRPLAE